MQELTRVAGRRPGALAAAVAALLLTLAVSTLILELRPAPASADVAGARP